MAIDLNSYIAIKCVISGLSRTTGSHGPAGTPAATAAGLIDAAPWNDLVTGIPHGAWNAVIGLSLNTFLANNCAALDNALEASIWSDILDLNERYWSDWPTLPNPYPRARFAQPAMNCQVTTVADLSVALIRAWSDAQ